MFAAFNVLYVKTGGYHPGYHHDRMLVTILRTEDEARRYGALLEEREDDLERYVFAGVVPVDEKLPHFMRNPFHEVSLEDLDRIGYPVPQEVRDLPAA